MSSIPNDLEALTPGHFLIGEPLVAIPEPNVIGPESKPVLRYDVIREKQQQFWKRWKAEYLSDLQRRSKWKNQSSNVTVGTLVLIADDNVPPQKWPMGRVITVHPGADGRVRSVTLKTSTGQTTRAVAKIAPLPVEST
jgi:hypothetical protein